MTLMSMAKLQKLAKLLTKRNPSLTDALSAVYMGDQGDFRDPLVEESENNPNPVSPHIRTLKTA